MKKLPLLLISIVLVFGIAACETSIVEIPVEIEEPLIPVVPVEPSVTEPTSEVIIEFVDRFIEVPAPLERLRRYQPGTYMLAESRPNNQNGYVFVVVTIDDYGRIAGVYIDQTITTRNLFMSPNGSFYVLVSGNNVNIPDAYRLIELSTPVEEYPGTNDAIRSADLVVGIDNQIIRDLVRMPVNETKQMVGSRLPQTNGLNYYKQMQLVAQKIVSDNTTYGFNLVDRNEVITTTSIPGVDVALDVPLFLVQSILDGPARLTNSDGLRSITNPRYGSYQQGVYIDYSPTSFQDGVLLHGLSVAVVDEFGYLTGLYLDEIIPSTARASIVASKQILKDALAVTNLSSPWFEQANRLSRQIIRNQGINGISLVRQDNFTSASLSLTAPTLVTVGVSDVNLRVNEILLASQKNLSKALFQAYADGTYLVSTASTPLVFAYVTIENQKIVDVFFDRLVELEQAQIFRRDRAVPVQVIERRFSTPMGDVIGDVLVYQVNGVTYSVNAVTQVNDITLPVGEGLVRDQQINLTPAETTSLRPVSGWQTSSSLRQINDVQRRWVEDAQSVANVFLTAGNITDLHLIDGRIVNFNDANQVVATSFIDLVSVALYQARDSKNSIFNATFLPQTVPLADGSYIAHAAPEKNGTMSFSYLVVKDSQVITWIVDQTTVVNNRMSTMLLTSGTSRTQLIILANRLRNHQVDILTSIITKPAPNPIIASVARNAILAQPGGPSNLTSYAGAIDQVIRQAVLDKSTQDIEWIQDYFSSSKEFFGDRTLLAFQNITEWLPESITNIALSYEYRLVWRTTSRDLTISFENGRYSARIPRLDEDGSVTIDLEIYLPDTNIPLSRQTFELPLQRRSTFGRQILSSSGFNFPSNTLVADANYTLPTSELVSIVWQSNLPTVMTNTGQTLNVSQPTTVILTAFVDLDGNGTLGPNEPSRTYNLTILPLSQAVSRIEAELDTQLIGDFIGNKLSLSTVSSIWGLEYSWSSASQLVTIHPTEDGVDVFVAALDFLSDVPLTATLNVENNVVTKTFRVDIGNKDRYLGFATQDLPKFTTSLQMILGDSLFANYSLLGRFYRSEITFYTTDFGQFVDSQGKIIKQDPTIDACFEVVVSARYNGGTNQSKVTVTEPFCILSQASLIAQMREDRDQIRDYIVDLSMTANADIILNVPLSGFFHQYPIRWEVLEGQEALLEQFDLTGLNSGVIVVKSASGALVAGDRLRLRAVIDIPVESLTDEISKLVVIDMRE